MRNQAISLPRQFHITMVLLVVVCNATGNAMGQGAEKQTLAGTRDKYLLLDNRIIDTAVNAKLTVGTVEKHSRNPLFGEDKPWEQRFDNLYASVIRDEADRLYKLWYNPFIRDASAKGMTLQQRHNTPYRPSGRRDGVCYAFSRDGLRWVKPELGLVEFEGSKANNLVLTGSHGAGVFKDPHDPDPRRRFKMFHARDVLRFSPDGLRWGDRQPCEGVGSNGDTHNHMLWAPDLERYVAFVRLRDGGQRLVGRTESADLKHWTRAVEVLRNNQQDQAYAMPVFRYADVYLGLVAIFRTREDRVHTELAWSPDTVEWHRIDPGTPLVGNAANEGEYDWGCVYAADDPVVLDDEIRVYYGGSNGKHTSWREGFFCLATLRPDGWAGYEQVDGDEPALLATCEIPYQGEPIRITADVEKGGSVMVYLVDQAGTELHAAKTISKTITDECLDFGRTIEAERIRLRFEWTRAKLYSFGFRPAAD